MSAIQELLIQRRRDANKQMKALRDELKEIDTALAAIGGAKTPVKTSRKRGQMTVNTAIIEAIKNGCGTPTEIERFLVEQLSISTTKHSISTRLSNLKADDEITHDDNKRWVILNNETPAEESAGVSSVTGEVRASPNESETNLFRRLSVAHGPNAGKGFSGS